VQLIADATKKMLIGKRSRRSRMAERSSPLMRSSTMSDVKTLSGLLTSLNMLIETPKGFDYTGADCQEWMSEIGFSATRIEHLVGSRLHGDRIKVIRLGYIAARRGVA
jgi:hypothetical protein